MSKEHPVGQRVTVKRVCKVEEGQLVYELRPNHPGGQIVGYVQVKSGSCPAVQVRDVREQGPMVVTKTEYFYLWQRYLTSKPYLVHPEDILQ